MADEIHIECEEEDGTKGVFFVREPTAHELRTWDGSRGNYTPADYETESNIVALMLKLKELQDTGNREANIENGDFGDYYLDLDAKIWMRAYFDVTGATGHFCINGEYWINFRVTKGQDITRKLVSRRVLGIRL